MRRRTILKRLGVASAGIAGMSGAASAEPELDGVFEGIDRAVDVSNRAGQLPVRAVLTQAELEEIDADLSTTTFLIDEDQQTLDLRENTTSCYIGCCEYPSSCPDYCLSCYCDNCFRDEPVEA